MTDSTSRRTASGSHSILCGVLLLWLTVSGSLIAQAGPESSSEPAIATKAESSAKKTPASHVRATEASVSIQSISIGFDNRYKPGFWTPVHIELAGGSEGFRGNVEVVVPDGDGVATRFVYRDLPLIELGPGESRRIVRLIKPGRSNSGIAVEVRQDNAVVARRGVASAEMPTPLAAERQLILSYGPTIGIEDAIGRKSRYASNVEVCELSDASQLPTEWLGLESADVLVLTTSDLPKVESLSAGQLDALREWVIHGGQLIFSVGKNGAELLGEKGPLSKLLPGQFEQVSSLRSTSALETYARSVQRLELRETSESGIPLTVVRAPTGRAELMDSGTSGQRPLIVKSPLGFGQVIFVAFDLDAPPIAEWQGRARVVSRLLQGSDEQADRQATREASSHVARFGYQDMVGQLRSALDQFPNVTFVAFSWVAGLVLVYIVVIVPVDYFFLRDVMRRMTLTWVTFPLMTLLFAGLAVWLSYRWKGNDVHINQVDLVDVDVATGSVRGTTWAHLYSPRAATYDLSLQPDQKVTARSTVAGNVLSWQGLPGTGLGGLNTAAAAPPAIDEYQMVFAAIKEGSSTASENTAQPVADPLPFAATMHGVPIHIASTKSLVGRWWGDYSIDVKTTLMADADGLLRGELANPLPIELNDCIVYFENWAFRLDSQRGTLRPGQSTKIENERALNLQWRLTGRRVIESKDFSTPWDQYTLAVPRIMEMMMFHSAAGGETYTQLVNRYQAYVDLSSHLQLGRAILIGRTKSTATKLVLNDSETPAEQSWTYYRVLFPVADSRPR